jgi:hypothetical protein
VFPLSVTTRAEASSETRAAPLASEELPTLSAEPIAPRAAAIPAETGSGDKATERFVIVDGVSADPGSSGWYGGFRSAARAADSRLPVAASSGLIAP